MVATVAVAERVFEERPCRRVTQSIMFVARDGTIGARSRNIRMASFSVPSGAAAMLEAPVAAINAAAEGPLAAVVHQVILQMVLSREAAVTFRALEVKNALVNAQVAAKVCLSREPLAAVDAGKSPLIGSGFGCRRWHHCLCQMTRSNGSTGGVTGGLSSSQAGILRRVHGC